MFLSGILATVVLVTNCVAAISTATMYGIKGGISTVFEGDCHVVNQWSLGLHLLINTLSTLLLGASNYTMQVLNAPTRSECDQAHARGDWLDVGITSLRNVTRITWLRKILWISLGMSSVPIHLLYNSAAFKTIDGNSYSVVIATPKFLESDILPLWPGNTKSDSGYDSKGWWNESEPLREVYLGRKHEFALLNVSQCFTTYHVDFLTGYSDLIAIIPEPINATFLAWVALYSDTTLYGESYHW